MKQQETSDVSRMWKAAQLMEYEMCLRMHSSVNPRACNERNQQEAVQITPVQMLSQAQNPGPCPIPLKAGVGDEAEKGRAGAKFT